MNLFDVFGILLVSMGFNIVLLGLISKVMMFSVLIGFPFILGGIYLLMNGSIGDCFYDLKLRIFHNKPEVSQK